MSCGDCQNCHCENKVQEVKVPDLWRFRVRLLSEVDDNVVYSFENPVPIMASGKVVGFAVVYFAGDGVSSRDGLYAEAAADYSLPERLTAEVGDLYLVPHVTVTPVTLFSDNKSTRVEIHCLKFSPTCEDPMVDRIGAIVL